MKMVKGGGDAGSCFISPPRAVVCELLIEERVGGRIRLSTIPSSLHPLQLAFCCSVTVIGLHSCTTTLKKSSQ